MPWHMKNLFLHQVVEQGVVGALLLAALVAAALWRLAAGAARREPLAPPLAAALVGFLLIGVGDSLLDAPRIAFLFYLLLMAALTLPAARRCRIDRAAAPPPRRAVRSPRRGPVRAPPARSSRRRRPKPPAASRRRRPRRRRDCASPSAPAARSPRWPRRRAASPVPTLIEVDAGEYRGDVAVWDRGDVVLRAVGGRVRLVADGAAAEGKAIWVVRNAVLDVTGFDFIGARVADANGAGIRLESGRLSVHDCAFGRNENGILAGNNRDTVLIVEDSEFGYNGHGDGQSHDLYAGSIASLRVTGSWFHHADRGHLLKSRAARSLVAYNLLADGVDGRASYELEFPNGGVAIVIGNLIQQAATTDNPVMISYGVEGYRWPRNELQLVNNTLVDQRPGGGTMLRVSPGEVTVRALNNLLLGNGAFDVPGVAERNHRVAAADLPPDADGLWRLPPGSRWAGQAIDPGRSVDGEPLRPAREYRHPRSTALLQRGDAAAARRPAAAGPPPLAAPSRRFRSNRRPAAARKARPPAMNPVDFPAEGLALGHPRFRRPDLAALAVQRGAAAAWQAAATDGGAGQAAADIDGDFAFARRQADGSAVLAVDRFAVRTLCWKIDGGRLRFAPRADDLAGENPELDPQALFDYLFHHAIPSPRTVFKDVHRLPPGHVGEFAGGSMAVRPYWNAPNSTRRPAPAPPSRPWPRNSAACCATPCAPNSTAARPAAS